MAERRGEKIGWTGGWLGGFIWVAVLAVVFMFQHQWPAALAGLGLVALAVIAIVLCAPWRHPTTPYWKLMLVPYALFLLTVGWAVWAFGLMGDPGLAWWQFAWVLSILTPLVIIGRRRWNDHTQKTMNGSR